MKFQLLQSVALLCLLLVSKMTQAQLTIEITQSSASAIPIAVVPFANKTTGVLPQDVSRIIANNLDRCGDFRTLPTSKMFSLPENMTQVHFRDWRLLGQNYILVGNVTSPAGSGRYEITYELVDIVSQKRLIGSTVTTVESGLRKAAHHISDAVYEAITGVRGAFNTKIAYISVYGMPGGKREYRLQVADADGENSRVLFKSHEPMLSIAWSNDAQHLAYVSYHSGKPAIYLQHIASLKQRKLTAFEGINGAPAWSPDDTKMLMTLSKDGNPEIYLYDLVNNKYQRLTNHYDIDTEASWSPNGRDIVFTSGRSGRPQVYLMSLNDLNPKRMTFEGKYNARPRFSLDGRRLFFVHQGDRGFNIAAIEMETNRLRILTSTPLDESPSVSPNGRMIIYSTKRNGRSELAVVSIDGGGKYFLPAKDGEVKEPAWSPFLK